MEWHTMRRHVPVLKAVKQKLLEMQSADILQDAYPLSLDSVCCVDNTVAIQKVINTMAIKLRQNNTRGCHYIEAINDYITSGINS